ncbi:MAG: MBL fold metallo-hydrolase RNA specificity domain-containing protein, partial [Luteolibacter sp.]
VPILGGRYKVRAKIEIIDSFSGHADHSELLDYFDKMSGPKQRVWLVHGEPDHAESLRVALAARHSGSIEIAALGQEVEF